MQKKTKKGIKLVAAVSMALLGMSYGMIGQVQAAASGDVYPIEKEVVGDDGKDGAAGGDAKVTGIDISGADGLSLQQEYLYVTATGGKGDIGVPGGVAEAVALQVKNSSRVTIDISGEKGIEVNAKGGAGGAGADVTANRDTGAGETAGNGGSAKAQAVVMDAASGTLKVENIKATATAGNGGNNAAGTQSGIHGVLAKADALQLDNAMLKVIGEALHVNATASNASGTGTDGGNQASGIWQTGGDMTYTVTGEMAVQAHAIGDGDFTTATDALASAMNMDGGTTTISAKGLRVEAGALVDGGGESFALGLSVHKTALTINAGEDGVQLSACAGIIQKEDAISTGKGEANGLYADENADIHITTTGTVDIYGLQANKDATSSQAYGAELENATLSIQADKGITFSAANAAKMVDTGSIVTADVDGTTDQDNEVLDEAALYAKKSKVTLDAGDEKVTYNGNVVLDNGSVLTLKSSADVKKATVDGTEGSGLGALGLKESTLILRDNAKEVTTTDALGLANGKVYFYNDNDPDEKWIGIENHSEYTQDNFRKISVGDEMVVQGDKNEIFVRTNSLVGDVGDRIVAKNKLYAADDSAITFTVFDEGMKTGYNGTMDGTGAYKGDDEERADEFDGGTFETPITIIKSEGIEGDIDYEAKALSYDNGVWSYAYEVDVDEDADKNVVLKKVATTKAEASSAQKTAVDASTAAAASAVSFFGADETLHERLGDLRSDKDGSDKENGIWAKYVGGRLTAEGIVRDTKVKYNGVEIGYDHYLGNNWTVGLAGEYIDGDTTLTAGSGSVKTKAGALYGTWLGDKGHHLDIIAKVGKVESETHSFGGTIVNKMDGDFDANAYSLSVEYGRKYDVNDDWFVTPAARLSYVHMGSAGYDVKALNNTMHARNDSFDSFILRAGARVGKKLSGNGSFYFKLAALYDFDGDAATTLTADGRSAKYENDLGGFGLEYGAGFDYSFGAGSLYFDLERISGGDLEKDWGVNAGFRYQF